MILLMTTLAWGDAIPMAPECPEGAQGRTSHAGQWCDLVDTSACLCFVEETVPCGGRRPMGDECTFDRKRVVGACDTDGACAEGTCASAEACGGEPKGEEPEVEEPKTEEPKVEGPKTEEPEVQEPRSTGSEEGCSHVPLVSGALGLGLLLVAGRRRR